MKIRSLSSASDYHATEQLQGTVLGFPDLEVVPSSELVIVQANGGHIFGAFEGSRMAAFCFGLPAIRDRKPYHCSRMLAVRAGLQGRGLGFRMKKRQRTLVLKQGLDRIEWTFDPLQVRNAHFNLEKLGCLIRRYVVEIYPGSRSPLNRGLSTDRFLPVWWIASRRVRERLRGRRPAHDLDRYAPALQRRDGRPGTVRTALRHRRVRVEVHPDINTLKKTNLPLARKWRASTRRVFQAYLRRDYVVHGFHAPTTTYLLERGGPVP